MNEARMEYEDAGADPRVLADEGSEDENPETVESLTENIARILWEAQTAIDDAQILLERLYKLTKGVQ